MMKRRRICAILLALGVSLGAKAYFLTAYSGRICYRALPESTLIDTGRSLLSIPLAEDRALLSHGLYLAGRAALTRALEDFCS